MCYTLRDMDSSRARSAARSIALRGISFAVVAALAFGAGLLVAGNGSSVSSVVSQLPLIGNGLDATPDQSADLTDFWEAWNALRRQLRHHARLLDAADHSAEDIRRHPGPRGQLWRPLYGLLPADGGEGVQ